MFELQSQVMECMVKDRIGSHVPKLFSAIAGFTGRGHSPTLSEKKHTGKEHASEVGEIYGRLKELQDEARKAVLLVNK